MLSFLDFLGTLGAAVLGLPGILGLALGMATRNWLLAMVIGGIVGVLALQIFGGSHATHLTIPEIAISVVVGMFAGWVGCFIRHKGASV